MCDSRRPSEGADSESVPRGNRPAEESLRALFDHGVIANKDRESWGWTLDAALRAERLAGRQEIVEHIEREAKRIGTYHGDPTATPGGTGYCIPAAVATQIVDKYILDEVGLTEERNDAS